MKKNLILVTGGKGRFANILKKENKKLNLYFANKIECNILKVSSLEKIIKRIKPKFIMHCASLSRPMKIHETDISKSINLNIIGTANVTKICIKYNLDGKEIDYLPAASEDQFNIKPVYKTFPGWKEKTQGIKSFKDLPDNAKRYIHAIEDFIGAKISSISTSPERDDTILVEDPFES